MIPQHIANAPDAAVERAFSKQSLHFDQDDDANPVLRDMRQQVYRHVDRFIKPGSAILELNAGTGIDALRFVSQGHRVHAIDIAEGMVAQIQKKRATYRTADRLTCQQLSYESIDRVEGDEPFDFVFSNFGGLNCIPDLSVVSSKLEKRLKAGAFVTWVIMPRICPWEIASIVSGNRSAFRRLGRKGTMAHLEGEYFRTWYHSFGDIRKAMGPRFGLVRSEGLASLSPPPHATWFPERYPTLYAALRKLDGTVRNHFPFNRWADHIIVTFRYKG